MRDRQTCVGCGKQSPETETNYTLISAQFGWRLTRYKSPEGSLIVEWRCPSCWRDYKRARVIKPGESNPPPAPSPADPVAAMPRRTPVMPARTPTPLGAFRPRSPSSSGSIPAEDRRSSGFVPAPDRRPSAPQRSSPTPRPAAPGAGSTPRPAPPHPSQPPPAASPSSPPARPGRGSR